MPSKAVVNWLLEDNQPSIRYRTLTDLLGRPRSNSDVREVRSRIPRVGWAEDLLTERNSVGM